MSYSNYEKAFKQLKVKPAKLEKYKKCNSPKERKTGIANRRCRRCGRIRGHIKKYGLHVCRQCFREIAQKVGFKKYS